MLGNDRRAPDGVGKKIQEAVKTQHTNDPLVYDILTARAVNRALGTTIGPWDVGQLDDALIAAVLTLLQPERRSLPTAPSIERRKQEIRQAYWRRFGLQPPGYSS